MAKKKKKKSREQLNGVDSFYYIIYPGTDTHNQQIRKNNISKTRPFYYTYVIYTYVSLFLCTYIYSRKRHKNKEELGHV